MAPERTNRTASTQVGWWRYMKASASFTPSSAQAAAISVACDAETASGFSHNTCLPARAALIVHSACRSLGSGM